MDNEMRQQILCCVHQARKNFMIRKKKEKTFFFFFLSYPSLVDFEVWFLPMCLLPKVSSAKINVIFINMNELQNGLQKRVLNIFFMRPKYVLHEIMIFWCLNLRTRSCIQKAQNSRFFKILNFFKNDKHLCALLCAYTLCEINRVTMSCKTYFGLVKKY